MCMHRSSVTFMRSLPLRVPIVSSISLLKVASIFSDIVCSKRVGLIYASDHTYGSVYYIGQRQTVDGPSSKTWSTGTTSYLTTAVPFQLLQASSMPDI